MQGQGIQAPQVGLAQQEEKNKGELVHNMQGVLKRLTTPLVRKKSVEQTRPDRGQTVFPQCQA